MKHTKNFSDSKPSYIAASAILALSGFAVAGCSSTPDGATEPLTASAPSPVSTVAGADDTPESVTRSATGVPQLKNLSAAPPFGNLVTLSGEKVSLESLKGKVVVLDFWATWCGPCRMTIPMLQELHEKYAKDGLVIVGISDESEMQVKPFAEKMKMNYAVVADPVTDATWKQNYRVESLPTMVVIDRDGKIRMGEVGADTTPGKGTQDRLNELLPQLLAAK